MNIQHNYRVQIINDEWRELVSSAYELYSTDPEESKRKMKLADKILAKRVKEAKLREKRENKEKRERENTNNIYFN